MLYRNWSIKTYILYDVVGVKHTIHPEGKVDDSVCSGVITLDDFIPVGMKRRPKKINNEVTSDGD